MTEHQAELTYWTGCRCRRCTAMGTRVHRRRLERLAALGVDTLRTDVTEARTAITEWVALGFTCVSIARAVGFSKGSVEQICRGEWETADRVFVDRILDVSVRSLIDATPDHGLVPKIGTTRRLHALARMGWAPRALGGYPLENIFYRPALTISARWHRQVVALYDDHAMRHGPALKLARAGERRGWPPPLAWDEDVIDDPRAEPAAETPFQDHRAVFLENVQELRSHLLSAEQVCRRLGVTVGQTEIRLRRWFPEQKDLIRWFGTAAWDRRQAS